MTAKKLTTSTSNTSSTPSILTTPFCTIPDVACVIPRGKMDMEVSEDGFVLRTRPKAKSITTTSTTATDSEDNSSGTMITVLQKYVNGIFYVTTKDKIRQGPAAIQHAFIISLSQPVMIGKTAHSTLTIMDTEANILKLGTNITINCVRNIDNTKVRDYNILDVQATTNTLHANDQTTLLRRIFTSLFGKIGEADKSIFTSASGQTSFPCINKVNDGFLFPLRRAILFGFRPTICLPHTEIAEVRIGRGGTSSTRSFDLDIKLLDGKIHNFSMIAIEELDCLRQYVSTRTFGPNSASSSTTNDTTSNVNSNGTTLTSETSNATDSTPSTSVANNGPSTTSTTSSAIKNMNEEDSDNEADEGFGHGPITSLSEDEDDESYNDSDFGNSNEEEEEEDNEDGDEDEDDEEDDDTEDEDTERDDPSPTGKRKRSKHSIEKQTSSSGTEEEEDDEDDDDDDEDDDDDSELDEKISDDELSALMHDADTSSNIGNHSSSSSSANMQIEPSTTIASSRPKRAAAIVAAKTIDLRLEAIRAAKEGPNRTSNKKIHRSSGTEDETE